MDHLGLQSNGIILCCTRSKLAVGRPIDDVIIIVDNAITRKEYKKNCAMIGNITIRLMRFCISFINSELCLKANLALLLSIAH
jgi:hypothetical protein